MKGEVKGEYTLVLSDEEFHAVVAALRFSYGHVIDGGKVTANCGIMEPITSVHNNITALLDQIHVNFKI